MPQPVGQNGLKLPYSLQKELGFDGKPSHRQGVKYGRPARSRVGQSKAPRKSEGIRRSNAFPKNGDRELAEKIGRGEIILSNDERTQEPLRRSNSKPIKVEKGIQLKHPRSILKKPLVRSSSPSSDSSTLSRGASPGLVLDSSSRSFRDRLAQDDTEISKLEKLGITNKKLKKDLQNDGLDYLLEDINEEDGRLKRKRKDKEWLENKQRKVRILSRDDIAAREDSESGSSLLDGLDDSEDGTEENFGEGSNTDDSNAIHENNFDEDTSLSKDDDNTAKDVFADSDVEEGPTRQKQTSHIRENPYVPPIVPNTTSSRYIPPSLRNVRESESQTSERLKRQVQGHLNKLSEANLISILNEIEKLYETNSRQQVTSVLIELLLSLFCNPSTLQNTFVILHAAFVAAVYKTIGTDFGAQILSDLVERFDTFYNANETGKESLNLISFLANLFTFHVIGSNIVYDYIKLLLENLTESNTELLLRVIRDCGPQLRQDDPTALKTVVQMVQVAARRLSDNGQKMSVRTQFMIETITDLKNNKLKNATSTTGVASEHITRMRKVLGSLNHRSVKVSEPLRITREDIKHGEKTGKWWLVGASWKGTELPKDEATGILLKTTSKPDLETDDHNGIDLLTLSRQYQMNTDIRRFIFVAIMSAADFQDAYMRILKLRLKRAQEEEIPKVLFRCAAAESTYNPYYGLLAKKLCSEKRLRKNFEYALWAFFKRIGQDSDEANIDEFNDDLRSKAEQSIDVNEIANLAKLYGFLISEGSLGLSVLKVLDLLYLKEHTEIFVELLLVTIFLAPFHSSSKSGSTNDIVSTFERVATESPQLVERLKYFIKKHVRKSDLVAKQDRENMQLNCRVAIQTLEKMRTI